MALLGVSPRRGRGFLVSWFFPVPYLSLSFRDETRFRLRFDWRFALRRPPFPKAFCICFPLATKRLFAGVCSRCLFAQNTMVETPVRAFHEPVHHLFAQLAETRQGQARKRRQDAFVVRKARCRDLLPGTAP